MFLLDTNVVSEMRKYASGRADANVIAWVRGVSESSLYISAIIVQEIEIGILRLEHKGDHAQAGILRQWLEEQLLPGFAERVLAVDVTVARRSARLHVRAPVPRWPDCCDRHRQRHDPGHTQRGRFREYRPCHRQSVDGALTYTGNGIPLRKRPCHGGGTSDRIWSPMPA